MKPVMTDNEIDTFQRYLNDARVYVEYGSGGSTCIASAMTHIEEIWTVESNDNWVQNLKNQEEVAKRVTAGTIHFVVVDIGGNPYFWGYPQNDVKKDNWPEYSQAIQLVTRTSRPDVVLIDGRFRVACAIQVVMHCEKEDVKICIHDYTDRPHYHCVTEFLDVVEQVDTLTCFVKKKNVQRNLLEKLYEDYKYDAR